MSGYLIHFDNELYHAGNKNSGRYPRGSGERPYQHAGFIIGNKMKGHPKDERNAITLDKKITNDLVRIRRNKRIKTAITDLMVGGATFAALTLGAPAIPVAAIAGGVGGGIGAHIKISARERGYKILEKSKNGLSKMTLQELGIDPLKVKAVKKKYLPPEK